MVSIYNWADAKSFKIKNDAKALQYINSLQPKVYKPSLYSQYDETYSKSACTLFGTLTVISTIAEKQKDEAFEKRLWDFATIH